MKNSIKYCFVSISIVFLLNGCQKEESALPLSPQERQDQSAVIEACLTLGKTESSVKLAYLVKENNNVDRDDWYPVIDVDKNQKIYKGLSKWSSEDVQKILLENSTPSGDWYRIDEYCFNKEDNIAEVYSDLRTSYGDPGAIQAIKTWKYYSDGSIESTNTELFDLKTKNPISSDDASYMDNPPHLVKDYEELAEYLELPK